MMIENLGIDVSAIELAERVCKKTLYACLSDLPLNDTEKASLEYLKEHFDRLVLERFIKKTCGAVEKETDLWYITDTLTDCYGRVLRETLSDLTVLDGYTCHYNNERGGFQFSIKADGSHVVYTYENLSKIRQTFNVDVKQLLGEQILGILKQQGFEVVAEKGQTEPYSVNFHIKDENLRYEWLMTFNKHYVSTTRAGFVKEFRKNALAFDVDETFKGLFTVGTKVFDFSPSKVIEDLKRIQSNFLFTADRLEHENKIEKEEE
jgi:hypothetical protein